MKELKFDPNAGTLVRDPQIAVPKNVRFHTLREVAEMVAEAVIPEDFRIFPETAPDGTMIQYITAREQATKGHWLRLLEAVSTGEIAAVTATTRTRHIGAAVLGDLDRLGLTRDQLLSYCTQIGIEVIEDTERAEAAARSDRALPEMLENWKLRIQAQAAELCRKQRGYGANPTKSSLAGDLARWCREQDVRTDSGINPSESYIRTHILRDWTIP